MEDMPLGCGSSVSRISSKGSRQIAYDDALVAERSRPKELNLIKAMQFKRYWSSALEDRQGGWHRVERSCLLCASPLPSEILIFTKCKVVALGSWFPSFYLADASLPV